MFLFTIRPTVLAQNEYFDSPDFIAYLKYLLYWKKPEYAKFIVFPHALYFLHLLQEASFREALKRRTLPTAMTCLAKIPTQHARSLPEDMHFPLELQMIANHFYLHT